MRTITPICSLLLLILPALTHAQANAQGNAAQAPAALPRTAAPAGAMVYFISPENGARVTSPVTVRFGLRGMGIAPAGVTNPRWIAAAVASSHATPCAFGFMTTPRQAPQRAAA